MAFIIAGCSKNSDTQISDLPTPTGNYVVFAWNDLGMHCLNPSYDKLVILPPYNNLMVQVIKKGKIPEIITSGLSVEYSLVNNTSSADKGDYGQFWTNGIQLFGAMFNITSLAPNVGLKGMGLSGTMTASTGYFIAEGIPATPIDDSGTKDPFQQAIVSVKDQSGNILATTKATIPTSDEINCAKCHGTDAFNDILRKHDIAHGTTLMNSKPVLCAGCHGSPALGQMTAGSSGKFLSEAIHGYHADKNAACYDCHPGTTAKCNRSIAHTSADGNCITCHGTMDEVASTIEQGRVPWVTEPKCVTCHKNVTEVDTGNDLYRNSHGHGNLYCTVCHGSPHAMYPSSNTKDNYQSQQYQGADKPVKTIGSCGVCHRNSRGESNSNEFAEKHGGANPEKKIACHTCHTEVPTNTQQWPHSYTWKDSGGNSSGVGD